LPQEAPPLLCLRNVCVCVVKVKVKVGWGELGRKMRYLYENHWKLALMICAHGFPAKEGEAEKTCPLLTSLLKKQKIHFKKYLYF